MTHPRISVVIPVYNSSSMLVELHARLSAALNKEESYEIVFVEDGSPDNSWEVLRQLKEKDPAHVVAISLARNFGQHNAILCGFANCRGQLVVTMDDDLQHPPEEVPKLIRKQEESGSDMVYGVYINRNQGQIRSAGSLFMRKSSKYVANTIGEGSSFRLIRREITDKLVLMHSTNFIFIDEVIQWYTQDIVTVKVDHHSRKSGSSTYTPSKLFSLWRDIVYNYSAVPLKLMTRIGTFSSVLFFLIGLRFFIRKLLFQIPLGYTSIIVSILFSASIILMSLGIIGQYLHKLFNMQNRRPTYSVKKILR